MKLTNMNKLDPKLVTFVGSLKDSRWSLYKVWLDKNSYIEICEVKSTGSASYASLKGSRQGKDVVIYLENKQEVLEWTISIMHFVKVNDIDAERKGAMNELRKDFEECLII